MGKSNTFIELNGQKYDAKTGTPLGGKHKKHAAQAAQHIDGIVRRPAQSVAKPKAARQPAGHAAHHKPQSAKTLMRSAVKKPDVVAPKKSGLKAAAPLSKLPNNLPAVKPKLSLHALSDERLKHASRVMQSQAIRRFAPITPTAFVPATPKSATATTHVLQAKQATAAAAPASAYDHMFERALHHANSHAHAAPKKKKGLHKRLSAISLSVMAVVVLGGFVASQNLTDIRLQMASSKAGFSAAMPAYHPSGFHVSGLQYGPGSVAINYDSNSDSRSYTLTEKTSSWDSQALRETFVSQAARSFETAEQGGRTIYIYGNNQATWVSGGIWYQVQNDGALSARQLVDLAASL